MFLREGDVGVNGNYLSNSSNSVISSGLAIRFPDGVVIPRNRATDAPAHPNFGIVSLPLVWPKITPFITPCQVLCLFLFLFAPTSPSQLTGLSRKSYWHLAKTLSTNMGLSNAFLEKQGLVSIRTLWIQIHYPAKAQGFLRTAHCGPA